MPLRVPNTGDSFTALRAISADAGRQAARRAVAAGGDAFHSEVTALLDDGPEHMSTAPAFPAVALEAFVDECLRLAGANKQRADIGWVSANVSIGHPTRDMV